MNEALNTKQRVLNFSAGPATLPESVLKRAQAAIWNLENSGIGVLEHSHRGAEITAVFAEAKELLRELASIPKSHDILFLQGGASSQFFMVPMNFLSMGESADYLVTGTWSVKAQKEAQHFGTAHIAATSKSDDKSKNFTEIPKEFSFSQSPKYLHYTSNNTVVGTQWVAPPTPPKGVPLVCDASSDILSRPISVSDYGLIYAGAQKNLGPAGLTLVIANKNWVAAGNDDVPTMLSYRTHADRGSMFNTPPVFAVYLLKEMLLWVKEQGGLASIETANQKKAAVIYDALDESSVFAGTVAKDSRSKMNICFRSASPELDEKFIAGAEELGLRGLKGHRTVGGMRASIYNAFPLAGCEALASYIKKFEKRNG